MTRCVCAVTPHVVPAEKDEHYLIQVMYEVLVLLMQKDFQFLI